MLTLKQWMELANYKITEGSEYYSDGVTLYCLDSWGGNSDGYNLCVVFDPTKDQWVRSVEVCDYKNKRAYRISNLTDKDDHAWDDVKWIDLECDEDFITKATAIQSGEPYDTRIDIPLRMTDDELLVLFKLAHAADMTFNDYAAMVIEKQLSRTAE